MPAKRGRLDNAAAYATAAGLVVALTILFGITLRLLGLTGGAYSWFTLSHAGEDSWFPMGLAYSRVSGQVLGSLHDLFFVEHVKFQYPASSLLLYSALDGLDIQPTAQALNVIVWLSILATSAVVARLCLVFAERHRNTLRFEASQPYLIAAAFAAATLFFYPIMVAWRLGQVQAILDLLFAVACLFWLERQKFAAGLALGVICLVKPQFSMFLAWAVLRRERAFAIGQLAAFGAGLLLSLALYGWANNVYYWDVLTYISRHGEIFWDNTSINGLVNRFVHPDQSLIFEYSAFPPYNAVIYGITLASSVALIGCTLFAFGKLPARGSVLDFMSAGLCFTVASPIAWGHHYGVAMPMLAVACLEIAARSAGRRRRNLFLLWTACFLLLADDCDISRQVAATPFAVLQSWRLFAVFGLLGLMYRLQTRPAGIAADRTAAPRPIGAVGMMPVALQPNHGGD